MRWPWVSRAEYDAVIQHRQEWSQVASDATVRAEAADRRYDALLTRYDALLEKYHALKLQGASEPQVIQPAPKREPDPIVQAINRVSRGDPVLRAQMLRRAEIDGKTMGQQEIIAAIESGVPSFLDGVPA